MIKLVGNSLAFAALLLSTSGPTFGAVQKKRTYEQQEHEILGTLIDATLNELRQPFCLLSTVQASNSRYLGIAYQRAERTTTLWRLLHRVRGRRSQSGNKDLSIAPAQFTSVRVLSRWAEPKDCTQSLLTLHRPHIYADKAFSSRSIKFPCGRVTEDLAFERSALGWQVADKGKGVYGMPGPICSTNAQVDLFGVTAPLILVEENKR